MAMPQHFKSLSIQTETEKTLKSFCEVTDTVGITCTAYRMLQRLSSWRAWKTLWRKLKAKMECLSWYSCLATVRSFIDPCFGLPRMQTRMIIVHMSSCKIPLTDLYSSTDVAAEGLRQTLIARKFLRGVILCFSWISAGPRFRTRPRCLRMTFVTCGASRHVALLEITIGQLSPLFVQPAAGAWLGTEAMPLSITVLSCRPFWRMPQMERVCSHSQSCWIRCKKP